MNTQRPRLPYCTIVAISMLPCILLTNSISFDTLSAMLDFLGIITPILFTAFGIWIGIIDPSKILLRNSDKNNINSDDSIVYELCYYLMCCTGILITIIILKFIFFTHITWELLVSYIAGNNTIYIIKILKYFVTVIVTSLYCSILWISMAILVPLIATMNNYKKIEQDNRIIGGK